LRHKHQRHQHKTQKKPGTMNNSLHIYALHLRLTCAACPWACCHAAAGASFQAPQFCCVTTTKDKPAAATSLRLTCAACPKGLQRRCWSLVSNLPSFLRQSGTQGC
jgi:hypothetical protein